jgi:hypothetical protein
MRAPEAPILTHEDPRRRPWWVSVGTSVLLHGSLVTLVLWTEARPDFLLRAQPDSVELAGRRASAVQMIFLPPPKPSDVDGRSRIKRPAAPPAVEPPAPEPAEVAPERAPPKGDEGAPSEEDNVAADGGAIAPVEAPEVLAAPAPPSEAPRRHNPSIAFRGGRVGSPITAGDQSPAWQRAPSVADATPRCRPGPARSASDPIDWGVVAGRVYRLGTTDPLVGATLQITGTPYTAISDEHGDYVLRFDAWPLRNCEAQYVRVQMDGFVTQTLVLAIGATTRSDVQLRGR